MKEIALLKFKSFRLVYQYGKNMMQNQVKGFVLLKKEGEHSYAPKHWVNDLLTKLNLSCKTGIKPL